MNRLGIQVAFVVLTVLWFGFSALSLFGATFGDCFEQQLCDEVKKASAGLVMWRWFAGCLLVFMGYRFFRKDEDVL